MNSALLVIGLVLTAVGATAVVLTREPIHQVLVLAVYGFVLTVLFVLYQAPDVALSQLTVGAAALPLMVMLTIAKVRRLEGEEDNDQPEDRE